MILSDETEADVVNELRTGMFVWFADADVTGFREVAHIDTWTAEPNTWNHDLAIHWTTVTYTDGHVEERVRYGTFEIWESGPRPMVGAE